MNLTQMDLTHIAGLKLARQGGDSGLATLEIENAFCTATVALQGAQLLSCRTQQGELLWLSERAVYTAGKAIRGGIPLCFPWFGPHPADATKPAHGFARNRPWELVSATAAESGHQLRFRLQDDTETRTLWPHAFVAELDMHLGERIELTLAVSNRDHTPLTFTFAFHSYFPVTDVKRTHVDGLQNIGFIDQLQPALAPQSEPEAIRFRAETDRIYTGTGERYAIIDEFTQTGIDISAAGCHSAVVWNPWTEKTLRLGDMAPDAWQRMVCVESGNIGSDAVTLAPGATQRFCLRLSHR